MNLSNRLFTMSLAMFISLQSFALLLFNASAAVGMEISSSNQLFIKAIEQNDLGAAKKALDLGAEINMEHPEWPCIGGYLAYALHIKDIALFDWLLRNRIDINRKNVTESSVISTVAELSDAFLNYANLLHEYKADLNIKGFDRMTPLHHAVIAGNIAGVKFFLGHGADFNTRRRSDGESPVDSANRRGNQEIIALLNEVIAYQNAVRENKTHTKKDALENVISNTKTAFTKYEWLTRAVVNDHIFQIKRCIQEGIFTPFEILEGFVVWPQMPLSIFGSLWEQVDEYKKNKIKRLSQEKNNQEILDAIMQWKMVQKDAVIPDIKFLYIEN